jgi:hypothetical protein
MTKFAPAEQENSSTRGGARVEPVVFWACFAVVGLAFVCDLLVVGLTALAGDPPFGGGSTLFAAFRFVLFFASAVARGWLGLVLLGIYAPLFFVFLNWSIGDT